MKRLLLLTSILIISGICLTGQDNGNKPKLVVGIIVDQMRFDYLYKYENKYSEGGFKRLLREGYNFKNAHYNYAPTVTAAGHASIYTGTTPANHGIIGNKHSLHISMGLDIFWNIRDQLLILRINIHSICLMTI